jgi:hypothetical protein
LLFLKIARETQGGLDVFGLGALVPASQKNDQFPAALLEIHPVTGAVVNSQLGNTFANRSNISGISGTEPFNPCLHTRPPSKITQSVKPPGEDCSLANLKHRDTVAGRLHIVKRFFFRGKQAFFQSRSTVTERQSRAGAFASRLATSCPPLMHSGFCTGWEQDAETVDEQVFVAYNTSE